jgi:hypothetical protein
MKMIKNLLRAAITDFWMLPLGVLILFWHEKITRSLQMLPALNLEKVGSIIPAIVTFLFLLFFVRLYFYAQYPDVYSKGLMRKTNPLWQELSSFQQFLLLRLERWVLLIAAAIIVSGMIL